MRFEARRFVQESYDSNDEWGKQIVIEFLASRGFEIIPKEEDYGVDIEARHIARGHILKFEVEVKHRYPWTCIDDFKFDSVSFLGRKKKWAVGQGFCYFIVCAETKAIIACHSEEIYQDKHKEFAYINTAHRKGNDELYRVPKQECSWLKIIW